MREQHGRGLADELKAAARGALHLGARYAEAGRAWFNQRTSMMNQRQPEPQWRQHQERQQQAPSSQAQGRYTAGGEYGSQRETGYGQSGYNQPGYNQPGEYGSAAYRGSEYGGPEERSRQQHYRDSGWQPGRGYGASQPGSEYGQPGRHEYERGGQYGGDYSGDYERAEYQRNAPRASMGTPAQTYESGYTDWRRGAGRDYDSERGYAGYYGQAPRGSHLDEPGQGLGRYGGRRQMETAGFGFDEDYPRRSGLYGRGYGAGSGYTGTEENPQQSRYAQQATGTDYGGRTSQRGRGPRQYTRSDERILEDVCERLTDDDYIDASDVTVRVDSGMVTLSGEVPERWMKHRAEDMADACTGVRQVENRLRVQGGGWSPGSYQSRSASVDRGSNGNTTRTEGGETPSGGTQTH